MSSLTCSIYLPTGGYLGYLLDMNGRDPKVWITAVFYWSNLMFKALNAEFVRPTVHKALTEIGLSPTAVHLVTEPQTIQAIGHFANQIPTAVDFKPQHTYLIIPITNKLEDCLPGFHLDSEGGAPSL